MDIYVNTDSLLGASEKCQELCTQMSGVMDSFNHTVNTLDFDIRSKDNIQKYIQKLGGSIAKAQKLFLSHSIFFNETRESYFEAERFNEEQTGKLKNSLFGNNYKGGGGSISHISDIKSKNIYDKVYSAMENAIFSGYRNVSNLKSLSCTVTLTSLGISFGRAGYKNTASAVAAQTYAKACAIISAAKSNLMQKVWRYYPTLKKAALSFSPILIQTKMPYSSSYTAVYKLSLNVYF